MRAKKPRRMPVFSLFLFAITVAGIAALWFWLPFLPSFTIGAESDSLLLGFSADGTALVTQGIERAASTLDRADSALECGFANSVQLTGGGGVGFLQLSPDGRVLAGQVSDTRPGFYVGWARSPWLARLIYQLERMRSNRSEIRLWNTAIGRENWLPFRSHIPARFRRMGTCLRLSTAVILRFAFGLCRQRNLGGSSRWWSRRSSPVWRRLRGGGTIAGGTCNSPDLVDPISTSSVRR